MHDFSTSSPHLLPVVGLTGGIGSGKTTVAGILESLGIPVFDADARAKSLYQRNADLRAWVVDRFGETCGCYQDGQLIDIDRKALADTVFSNSDALEELNAVVHPVVARDFQAWHALQSEQSNAPYVVREAAILIETGGHKQCDSVAVVQAPQAVRLARAMGRLGTNPAQIEKRMQQQLSDEARREHAHFVVDNADENNLLRQVLDLHKELVDVHAPRDRKTP
jgi:dephospho-CoA kinase